VELTIVMPCLNEAETLETCIVQATNFLTRHNIDGEVLVADNGSTDGSLQIAAQNGARVINVPERGYGSALRAGIAGAQGKFVAMGDADDSYDFGTLRPFIELLRNGDDLVMGNRFAGGIAPGAMPWLHKYVGNPVLSFIGRLFFKTPIRDFHCGLRAFRRDSIIELDLRTTGMEFASEMVVKASLAGLRVSEVPTTLKKDGRSRPPHLRSFRDGWRHLRFLLLYSPNWLFLYPGLFLTLLGLFTSFWLTRGPIHIGDVGFDIGTLVYAISLTIVGYQSVLFSVLARLYGQMMQLVPLKEANKSIERRLTIESGIVLGLVIVIIGLSFSILSFLRWKEAQYGDLEPSQTIRTVAPAFLGLVLGVQTMLAGIFGSLLRIQTQTSK
jgi:glycosyltransferase involved in cell wall biosynthesis